MDHTVLSANNTMPGVQMWGNLFNTNVGPSSWPVLPFYFPFRYIFSDAVV